jgi:putative exosortase-associated protein (TIGR04073 family)
MRTKLAAWMLVMGFILSPLGLAAPASAQEDMPRSESTESHVPAQKLARGLENTILGWTELVTRPSIEAEQKGASGVITGLVNGVSAATMRTVTGPVEVVTFWSSLPVKYQPPLKD